MLVIRHARLSIPGAQDRDVREVSAPTLLIPTALLTAVIVVVIMVTAAAVSAVLRKPAVILIAIARTACVIVPRQIALINAPPTIV
jgi:hypothetical protein